MNNTLSTEFNVGSGWRTATILWLLLSAGFLTGGPGKLDRHTGTPGIPKRLTQSNKDGADEGRRTVLSTAEPTSSQPPADPRTQADHALAPSVTDLRYRPPTRELPFLKTPEAPAGPVQEIPLPVLRQRLGPVEEDIPKPADSPKPMVIGRAHRAIHMNLPTHCMGGNLVWKP